MTIHVTIGEAEKRLAELVDAALNGEFVVIAEPGVPPMKIVRAYEPVPIPHVELTDEERARIVESRMSAFGMYAKEFRGFDTDIGPSMTDDEVEERWRRKFGPAV